MSEPAEILPVGESESLREVFGLPAVPPEGAVTTELVGEELTVSEADVVAETMTLAVEASRLEPAVEAALGDGYAGLWLDPAEGTAHIADAGGAVDASALAFRLGVPAADVEVDSVGRSMSELEAIWEQVDLVTTEVGYSVTGSGIDVERNQVVVEVTGSVEAAAADLGALGAGVAVREGRDARLMNSGRDDPGNPKRWEAGLRVQQAPNAGCTGGFRVKSGSASYVLTAGHCELFAGYPFYVGSPASGTLGTPGSGDNQNGPGSSADVVRIPVSGWAQPDCIYIGASNCLAVDDFGDPIQGSVVCQSGAATAIEEGEQYVCGVVESVNWTQDMGVYTLTHIAKHRQLGGYTCARPGDSGAPVFQWDTNGIVGVGIYAGSGGTGECATPEGEGAPATMFFSRWSKIASAYNPPLTSPVGTREAPPLATALATTTAGDPEKRTVWLFHRTSGRLSFTRHTPFRTGWPWERWKPWNRVNPPGSAPFAWTWSGSLVAGVRGTSTTVDVFVPGSDGALKHVSFTPATGGSGDVDTSVNGLGNPAGTTLVAATVAWTPAGGGEVFVRDATAGAIWTRVAAPDGTWASGSSWVAIANPTGRTAVGGLAAGIDATGATQLVALFDDGTARRISKPSAGSWSGQTWSSFGAPTGGLQVAQAGMAPQSNGHLDYFAAGIDGYLWHRAQTSTGWNAWQKLTVTAPPYGPGGGVSATLGPPTTSGARWIYAAGATPSNERSFYLRQATSTTWSPWCATGNDLASPCPELQ